MTRRLLVGAALLALVGLTATALTPALGSGSTSRVAALRQLVRADPLPPPSNPPAQPAVAIDPGQSSPGVAHRVTLRVGDSVLVDGAGIGCQVNRRGGRVFIECGRTGDVAGTYMTLVGKRTAIVARLRSAATGKIILTARHRGGWRACGTMPRAARVSAAGAGGRGCR